MMTKIHAVVGVCLFCPEASFWVAFHYFCLTECMCSERTACPPFASRVANRNLSRSVATSSALYLRTLLRVLDWAAANAYDVRALITKMLTTATSVGALYNVFFDR